MRILRSAALVVLVVALAGCAAVAAPTPTTSPAPAAGPEPDMQQRVTSIVISGSEFTTVLADGSVRDTVPFSSDPEAAVALLSELFAAQPVVSLVPQEHCSPSFIRSDWNGELKLDTDFAWLPEGQLFDIVATEPSVNGIEIDTSAGLGVGEDASEFIASLPPEQVEMFEYEGVTQGGVAFEVEGGSFGTNGYDAWGGQLQMEGMLVDGIASPVLFLASSTC